MTAADPGPAGRDPLAALADYLDPPSPDAEVMVPWPAAAAIVAEVRALRKAREVDQAALRTARFRLRLIRTLTDVHRVRERVDAALEALAGFEREAAMVLLHEAGRHRPASPGTASRTDGAEPGFEPAEFACGACWQQEHRLCVQPLAGACCCGLDVGGVAGQGGGPS